MPDSLLLLIEYGGYISAVKFLVFLILFFLWLPLLGWVHEDARAVGTSELRWTAVVFAAGVVGALLCLTIPIFTVGIIVYLAALATAGLSYVMHRNTKVSEFEKVLTPEHIAGLFSSGEKELQAIGNLLFITANNNEVPPPEARTADFFGYKAAYNLLNDVIRRRVSDVVFSPAGQDYSVTYRIDGAAVKEPAVPKEQAEYLIRFVKHLADMDINERRKPQKGTFRTNRDEEDIEWELTAAGSTVGEQIRLKRGGQGKITNLDSINLSVEHYEQLNKVCSASKGIFLVSGPGRNGVTTTFYALLRNNDAFINNINTLERQPSAELPNITQNIFALSDSGTTTFAKKLRAIVRMGPDIVGVADCNDSETAKIVCEAAKNGEAVYVTIKENNVIKAISKWIKLVGDKKLAVSMLLGVSNQRLFRKLCTDCKQAYEPNKEVLKKFNIPAEKAKVLYRAGKVQYAKHGKASTCETCQGIGFLGRMPVMEIITFSNDLRTAVMQAESASEIATHFRRAKMLYLQEEALKKVVQGDTSINEMIRVLSKDKKKKAAKR